MGNYWDGKEIIVRRTIRLGPLELWFVGLAAVGTLGSFLVEVGPSLQCAGTTFGVHSNSTMCPASSGTITSTALSVSWSLSR
jgi:peptidoglycan/LPS O-acetylase OafA/YrhL